MKIPNIDELLNSYIKDVTIPTGQKKEIIQKFRKQKLIKLNEVK
jgi:hypothetical protein